MVTKEDAHDALNALLWELPAEFGLAPIVSKDRDIFHVIGRRNVGKVHEALWTLQQYFEETD